MADVLSTGRSSRFRGFLRDIWPTLIGAAGWFAWVGSWFIL